jgi:hypothetical protein
MSGASPVPQPPGCPRVTCVKTPAVIAYGRGRITMAIDHRHDADRRRALRLSAGSPEAQPRPRPAE